MKVARCLFVTTLSIGFLCAAVPAASASSVVFGQNDAASANSEDSQIQADLTKTLSKSQFKDVKGTVQNGIVTLTGTVEVFENKVDAEKRAHRVKNVVAVKNRIDVAGVGDLSDRQLQERLVEKLQYDRVGYGNAFNAIGVSVQNGVVTLGGHARTPVDKDSAISLVSNFPGVRDVVDDIEVDPVSPMDDRIRMMVARSVYGFPSLNRYAIDPAKPIRISVQNGHVELNGIVDTQSDKDAAYIRANSVPGVFSVTNNLVVANPSQAKKKK